MAKHKKKKSPPIRETPDDITPPLEPVPSPDDSNVPPPDVPQERPRSNMDIEDRNRKMDRLYWFRIGLAVIAGIVATFLFEPFEGETRRWSSIMFMIVLFAGTVFVAKFMRIQLPSSDRKKIVTHALPSFIFLYLFMWILSYTIVQTLGGSTSASPF